jgi:erythronate-4-phosphate dehydrogenase
MKITVDRNMPLAPEAFATLGEVQVVNGRKLTADDLKDTTILAIRSTTKVKPELLEGSNVKFVGTATIGIDHLDIPYLESKGIHWVYSPGCNAQSVAEYITAALLQLATQYNLPLKDQTLGVIGVGNVGSLVVKQACALGMNVLLHDPPRARKEGNASFCELEALLAASDFVTMHVPLETAGPDATHHMADERFFQQMKPGAMFLNAARGAVVDTPALIHALDGNQVRAAVIDTWEGEPTIPLALQERVAIGTPHIAGHSYEGKANGTMMVYAAACRFLSKSPTFDPEPYYPKPRVPAVPYPQTGNDVERYHAIVKQVYDIMGDDTRLREAKDDATAFDQLRRNYPIRREFRWTTVTDIDTPETAKQLQAIGFGIA